MGLIRPLFLPPISLPGTSPTFLVPSSNRHFQLDSSLMHSAYTCLRICLPAQFIDLGVPDESASGYRARCTLAGRSDVCSPPRHSLPGFSHQRVRAQDESWLSITGQWNDGLVAIHRDAEERNFLFLSRRHRAMHAAQSSILLSSRRPSHTRRHTLPSVHLATAQLPTHSVRIRPTGRNALVIESRVPIYVLRHVRCDSLE
jgi:hypothetical protein